MTGLLLLFIFPLGIGFVAKLYLESQYGKYSKIPSQGKITGAEAAEAVMRSAGIHDVSIVEVEGVLTDHYDPTNKRLALSRNNFRGYSLAALGVAAHEAGHAIQHKEGHEAMKARAALVPMTGIASTVLSYVFIFSLFGIVPGMAKIAVVALAVIAVFQLVTLPVEFDASRRAKQHLLNLGILQRNEVHGVVSTLNAAGWTYVAALAAVLAQLFYFVLASRE